MRNLAIAVAGIFMLVAGAGPVMASPEGVWELETRDTRFQISLCGDGSQLCGKLVWLSDADYNDQYLPYLNTPVANAIKQDRPNRWSGAMQLFGQKINGTITLLSEDRMTLKGCVFFIACKSYQMMRYSK